MPSVKIKKRIKTTWESLLESLNRDFQNPTAIANQGVCFIREDNGEARNGNQKTQTGESEELKKF
ncbi:MAG: hypothetical protein LBF38_12095 [Deltaproteobacteria bacterium]|nr:hypothetical protein [Deltaproteobacteria bacterium]